MPDLWIFAALNLAAATAVFVGISKFRQSLRAGVGGSDEDLGQARRLYRIVLISALIFIATAGFAMFLGFRGAAVWRQTPEGQTVLNILLIAAAIGFARSFAKAGYQQWSGKGSFLGVLRETFLGFVMGGLLFVAMVWRAL